MTTAPINELTPARYHGLPVTVIGFAGQDLLAIAASGTPEAVAVAVLRSSADGYRVGTGAITKPTLAAAAIEAAHLREQRDRQAGFEDPAGRCQTSGHRPRT